MYTLKLHGEYQAALGTHWANAFTGRTWCVKQWIDLQYIGSGHNRVVKVRALALLFLQLFLKLNKASCRVALGWRRGSTRRARNSSCLFMPGFLFSFLPTPLLRGSLMYSTHSHSLLVNVCGYAPGPYVLVDMYFKGNSRLPREAVWV